MQHDLAANLELFAAIAVVGVAAILCGVSLLSYQRLRNPRALFIGLAFLVFAGKGVYLLVRAIGSLGRQPWLLPIALLDLLVLVLMYLAIKKR